MFEIGADQWPGISKLVEECGEVLQVCGKLMGTKGEVTHWDGKLGDLRERLTCEMGDLFAALHFVGKHCRIDQKAVEQRMNRKLAQFEEWHGQQTAEKPIRGRSTGRSDRRTNTDRRADKRRLGDKSTALVAGRRKR